jgi:hypothetical protein
VPHLVAAMDTLVEPKAGADILPLHASVTA